jgi:hypothetical protein
MNRPGVGLRKKTPSHFSKSFSAAVMFSGSRAIMPGKSSRIASAFPFLLALCPSTAFVPARKETSGADAYL